MSAINDFHHKAVDLSAFALMEQMRGNAERSAELFEQALENELAAIEELKEPVEPTYSVLHRSAGWMAFHCRKFRIAEKLAARALSHDPHPEIAEELRDLLEQINFGRHLKLKGVTLAANDIQLSLSGSEVGLGVIRASEFIDRISYSSKLVHRIIERRNNRPFRERGRPSSNIESLYQSYLSIPRAASYAVTLSFSTSSHQPSLPGISDIAEVVDEFMELMELLNSANVSEIQGRIPDPAYLRNFLGLAKK